MLTLLLLLLGLLTGFALFVWFLVSVDALGVYRKSVVTDYLIEHQAHMRQENENLLGRYDTIIGHQNKIIQLQNESPTLLAYLREIGNSQRENGVNHISQLKQGNDNAPKFSIKIKNNGDLILQKSEYNTLLVTECGNYIADITIEELQESNENKILVQEIPQKIWVVKCETCGTYFPTKSVTAATCSQNCRKQKSLNH